MTDPAERMARLEEWKEGHEGRCTERYEDIKSDANDIKNAVAAMAADLKSAVGRIHERIDGQDGRISAQKVAGLSALVMFLIGLLGYAISHWGPLAK